MNIKEINRQVVEQFRAGSEIEGMQRDRLVLLTTVGAKTGQRRTTPMMFHRDGKRLLVIASNVGAPRHPDWYINLVANPNVTVEVGVETYEAVANTVTGAERERLWSILKQTYPFFADHETKTDRTIPVVALTKTEPSVSTDQVSRPQAEPVRTMNLALVSEVQPRLTLRTSGSALGRTFLLATSALRARTRGR